MAPVLPVGERKLRHVAVSRAAPRQATACPRLVSVVSGVKHKGMWRLNSKCPLLEGLCCKTRMYLPIHQDSPMLVTRRGWRSRPTPKCEPLYVGGITGKSQRFRTRVGDLLADIFGFYNGKHTRIGHHSGGRRCEGIVSKRLDSPYRSGRSPHWVKVENPKASAVKREAEEDWGPLICGSSEPISNADN
jgi:hypothetical protein